MGFERGDNVSPVGTAFGDTLNASSVPVNAQASEKKPFTFSLPSNAPSPAAASFSFALPGLPAQQQSIFQQPQQQSAFQQPQQSAFQQTQIQPLMPIQLHSPAFQQPSSNQAWMQQNPGTSGTSGEHPSLSLSDLEQFKSEKFSFGRIPRTPPPKEFR